MVGWLVCLQHLWVMVVQEADLTGQLRVMKDFFLLGRGELCLAFIDQAQHLLKGPPAPSTEHGQCNLAPLPPFGITTHARSKGRSLFGPLHRPGPASAEGPPCAKHGAWSVDSTTLPSFPPLVSQRTLEREEFVWSPSSTRPSIC